MAAIKSGGTDSSVARIVNRYICIRVSMIDQVTKSSLTHLILLVRLKPHETAEFTARRVQDRSPDKVPRIRVDTIEDAPFEP